MHEVTPDAVRGRPRAFDEAEALDRALELFWINGYRATTARDLETSLGMSQSSIYNAFGSKHELLISALDRYEQQITRELVTPLETSADGLDGLLSFFIDLTEWVTSKGRRGCMIINLMAEDGGAHPELTRRTRAYRARVKEAIREALIRSVDRGQIPAKEIDVRADLLFGMVLGLNIAARGGAAQTEIDSLLASTESTITGWRTTSGISRG